MFEMDQLEQYLIAHNYDFVRETNAAGCDQIVVIKDGKYSWDAVSGPRTYGGSHGLLEVMGDPVMLKSDYDTVAGWLTAQDVIDRLEEKYV